jgi:hypothetical protein
MALTSPRSSPRVKVLVALLSAQVGYAVLGTVSLGELPPWVAATPGTLLIVGAMTIPVWPAYRMPIVVMCSAGALAIGASAVVGMDLRGAAFDQWPLVGMIVVSVLLARTPANDGSAGRRPPRSPEWRPGTMAG